LISLVGVTFTMGMASSGLQKVQRSRIMVCTSSAIIMKAKMPMTYIFVLKMRVRPAVA